MLILLFVLAYFFFVIIGFVFGALIGVIVLLARLATYLLRRPQNKRLRAIRTQTFVYQVPESHQQKLENHPDSTYALSFLPKGQHPTALRFAETQRKYAAIKNQYPITTPESTKETL